MSTTPPLKRRRPAAAALASVAVAATLCLQALNAPASLWEWRVYLGSPGGGGRVDQVDDYTEQLEDEVEGLEHALENEAEFRRTLMPVLMGDGEYATENDYDAAFRAARQLPEEIMTKEPPTVQPYTLEDALAEARVFEYTFTIIIYDPDTDRFLGFYSKDHKWKAGNKKLWKAMKYFVYMLRKVFPDRFTPDSPELVLAVGSGDYPHVRKSMLPHHGNAPVLMFGSAFRDPKMYGNMLAMPMPEPRHLNCFEEWAEKGTVCAELREGGLAFAEEKEGRWDDLIPQLVWRGTDFGYLPTLQPRPSLVHPDARKFIRAPSSKETGNKKVEAAQALNAAYDTLLPRWKGVALTAQAELDARGMQGKRDPLPWIDVRFSSYLDKGKSPTVGSAKYALWESVGMATGKGMSPSELSQYRYHIDLGGGGGTTWSGTIEKLAMPGLLFHHVTPTKDYIHDRLKPWRHYVPVAPDLRDLHDKYDWAEGHPAEAQRIADAGTEFMRQLGTPEGFGRMFEEDFVEPMRRVIEAYRPAASVHPEAASWREVMESMEDGRVMPVMECSGITPNHSCRLIGGEEVLRFQSAGKYEEK